jgi:serine/threonine protein kinase
MSIKVMIIDGQADFRTLLMHHVTTHWPEAIITAYDPISAGYLPAEFSGAGNDLILLGSQLGDRKGLAVLKQFRKVAGFPAVVYFGAADEQGTAAKMGAAGFFVRDAVEHRDFIDRLSDILVLRRSVASTQSLLIGDENAGIHPLIRGYNFVRKLNASAHSVICLTTKASTGQEVVLKVMRQVPDVADSGGAFDRFLQEYELIAEIDHPNIVTIFDLGVGDDQAHIAMEYLDGGDLRQRIVEGLEEADAVRCMRQIASALVKMHEVGILHRDLKPGNIMLRADDTIALIDFGLAKRLRLRMEITDEGEIFGTPYYMSPEQGHGSGVDARSDIYSLGVIFFEMLTGKKPFHADTAMGVIYKHAHAPIPTLPGGVAQHQELLSRLLAKLPEDRLQSAAEVEEWL